MSRRKRIERLEAASPPAEEGRITLQQWTAVAREACEQGLTGEEAFQYRLRRYRELGASEHWIEAARRRRLCSLATPSTK